MMKISVAMATYNGANYLETQLNSIFSQTLKVDEIVICDDCSTDGTPKILRAYYDKGLIKYHENSQRLNVIGNFKEAVSLAKDNNWIALADQDDDWMPDKLERSAVLLHKINDEQVPCIVYSDLVLIDDKGNVLKNSFQSIFGTDKYVHNLHTLLYTNFVTGCTILMNNCARRWFEEMPGDVRSHDEWLALVAFTFGKAMCIDLPTVKYRKHDRNVSMPEELQPGGRIKKVIWQSFKALTKGDDFLISQFKAIERFYEFYYHLITEDKKKIFEEFLLLKNRAYPIKKLAYRRMVSRNR